MSFLGTILLLACLPAALLDFATPKWKDEPNMEVRDAYKWLYQATNGGEHAVPSEAEAKQWLDKEWSSLERSKPTEFLWQPLCPDDSIGRFNLRPFKMNGGDQNDVLQAFLTSSNDLKGDGTAFREAWAELGKRLKKQSIGKLNYKQWRRLDVEMKAKDYPAVHHSELYEQAFHPAYRILTRSEMLKLAEKLTPQLPN
jgi:hypothetical protein